MKWQKREEYFEKSSFLIVAYHIYKERNKNRKGRFILNLFFRLTFNEI